MKYIVVTGSVMSGIGKGVTSSSIGVILQGYGLNVTAIKIDPYINPDCGTMSPFEHGECYVLNDGCETDLDLGNYERFLDISLTGRHNITTGKIYLKVIEDERQGKYLGNTVQVVPHITDAIQEWIIEASKIPVNKDCSDVCIIELGGTIGDIESSPFVEALRQMAYRLGSDEMFFCNVCYVPVLKTSNETKTKPAQNGIRELRRQGLNADLLIVRCERDLDEASIQKLSSICQIPSRNILMNADVNNIYQVPVIFHQQRIFDIINQKLNFRDKWTIGFDMNFFQKWQNMANLISNQELNRIRIAIIGKYTGLGDSYLSLTNAIHHAGIQINHRCSITFIESTELEKMKWREIEIKLKDFQAIVIPGGFGQRGIEGMIKVCHYARTKNIPCLGICLGFQIMVIEFARHVLGLTNANSLEFDSVCENDVITIMNENEKKMGGTMRLGSHETILNDDNSLISKIYLGKKMIRERYRHRYEVNSKYIDMLRNGGLNFTGNDITGKRMSILELKDHIFYLGTQYHLEYLSRPHYGHPIFIEWLSRCI